VWCCTPEPDTNWEWKEAELVRNWASLKIQVPRLGKPILGLSKLMLIVQAASERFLAKVEVNNVRGPGLDAVGGPLAGRYIYSPSTLAERRAH